MDEFKARFRQNGFAGAVRIIPEGECAQVLSRLRALPRSPVWEKGHAVQSSLYNRLAHHPRVVERVCALLGDNVVLWGASLVHRAPGQQHPWHTDIESSPKDARTVTVWIGLSNTNRNSSLQVISRSHLFGTALQEAAHTHGISRGQIQIDDVQRWAQRIDGLSRLEIVESFNGEAVFFDGRLWHGTDNTNAEGTRSAIILQYADAGSPIRIPDFSQLEWPFRFHDEPRPPCILVSGSGASARNSVVSDAHLMADKAVHYDQYLTRLRPGRTKKFGATNRTEVAVLCMNGEAEVRAVLDADSESVHLAVGSLLVSSGEVEVRSSVDGSGETSVLVLQWPVRDTPSDPSGETTLPFRHLFGPARIRESGTSDIISSSVSTQSMFRLAYSFSILPPHHVGRPHVNASDCFVVRFEIETETKLPVASISGIEFFKAGSECSIGNPGVHRVGCVRIDLQARKRVDLSEPRREWMRRRILRPARRWVARRSRRLQSTDQSDRGHR